MIHESIQINNPWEQDDDGQAWDGESDTIDVKAAPADATHLYWSMHREDYQAGAPTSTCSWVKFVMEDPNYTAKDLAEYPELIDYATLYTWSGDGWIKQRGSFSDRYIQIPGRETLIKIETAVSEAEAVNEFLDKYRAMK